MESICGVRGTSMSLFKCLNKSCYQYQGSTNSLGPKKKQRVQGRGTQNFTQPRRSTQWVKIGVLGYNPLTFRKDSWWIDENAIETKIQIVVLLSSTVPNRVYLLTTLEIVFRVPAKSVRQVRQIYRSSKNAIVTQNKSLHLPW